MYKHLSREERYQIQSLVRAQHTTTKIARLLGDRQRQMLHSGRDQKLCQAVGLLKPVTTPITSPQSNGMAESFVKTFKRDYAKLAHWTDSQTVMGQLKAWFDDYNSFHPHSALGYLPPQLFRERRSAN